MTKKKPNNLAKLMFDEDISQKNLAKKVGISKVSMNKLYNEETEPRTGLALKLAEALGTTVEKLFIVTEIGAAILCILLLIKYIE